MHEYILALTGENFIISLEGNNEEYNEIIF